MSEITIRGADMSSAEFMLAEATKVDKGELELNKSALAVDFSYYYRQRASDFIPVDIIERCCEDDMYLRGYVLKTFTHYTKALINACGEMIIDLEHIVILYNIVISDKSSTFEQRNSALGLLFLVGGLFTEEAFRKLRVTSRNGFIRPERKLTTSSMAWRRCNEVNRRYMLTLVKPSGYSHYYYWGAPNLSQIAYLCAYEKMPYAQAVERVSNGKSLWIPFLPQAVENNLCSSILEGEYGFLYRQTLNTFSKIWSSNRSKAVTAVSKTDLFSSFVLPTSLSFLGTMYERFVKERDKAGLGESDARLYLVGASYFGVALSNRAKAHMPFVSFNNGFKRVPDTVSVFDVFKGFLL